MCHSDENILQSSKVFDRAYTTIYIYKSFHAMNNNL